MTARFPSTGHKHPLRAKEGEGTAGPAADRSIERSDIQTDMHNSPNPVNDNPTTLQRTAAQSAQSSKRHRRRCLDGRGSEALQNALGTKEKEPRKSKGKEISGETDQKHIRKRGRYDFEAAVRLAKQALKHNSISYIQVVVVSASSSPQNRQVVSGFKPPLPCSPNHLQATGKSPYAQEEKKRPQSMYISRARSGKRK